MEWPFRWPAGFLGVHRSSQRLPFRRKENERFFAIHGSIAAMSEETFTSIISPVRHLHVTCAVIERQGTVLAAQRGAAMSMPLKWEFPGGKIDPGESAEACLRRELFEELGLRVHICYALPLATHAYPVLTVTLHPFVCRIAYGEPILHEHAAIAWLVPGELHTLDWAAADLPVIAAYRRALAARAAL